MNSPDPNSPSQPQRVWEHGWQEHEQMQKERLAKLTLAEKLQWLEDAHRLVRQMQQNKK